MTIGAGAIVDVLRTVRSRPSVDAGACEAVHRVRAGGSVLADAGIHGALVDVDCAVVPGHCGRTRARVAVHSVDARRAVGAEAADTVVDVDFAVLSLEAFRA